MKAFIVRLLSEQGVAACRLFGLLLGLICSTAVLSAQADGFSRFSLELEGGPLWNTRNDVRIPKEGGSDFSILDLTGKGPAAYFRVYANVNLAQKHSLRLLAAPIRTKGTGMFSAPVFFVDQTFDANTETEGIYEFNTYRVTYGYSFLNREKWKLTIGAAGLIRDAKIELRQEGRTARDTDLGFVPLIYFNARHSFNDKTYFVFDIEGLGATQGRAIDASAKFHYRLTKKLNLGFGYRTIEGGANADSVYNFAWLHFAAVSLGYDF